MNGNIIKFLSPLLRLNMILVVPPWVFDGDCVANTMLIVGSIVGILLLVGNILSYLPQVIAIVRSKNVDSISEFSLILLNLGSFCLSLNSVIFNWSKWRCFGGGGCGFWYVWNV